MTTVNELYELLDKDKLRQVGTETAETRRLFNEYCEMVWVHTERHKNDYGEFYEESQSQD